MSSFKRNRKHWRRTISSSGGRREAEASTCRVLMKAVLSKVEEEDILGLRIPALGRNRCNNRIVCIWKYLEEKGPSDFRRKMRASPLPFHSFHSKCKCACLFLL